MADFATKPNDSAHPYITSEHEHAMGSFQHGLTKREYFAGLAFRALLTNPHITNYMRLGKPDFEAISVSALEAADALIAELNKGGGQING